MKNQSGYYNISFGPILFVMAVICLLGGWLMNELFDFVWPYIKAWLHAATK